MGILSVRVLGSACIGLAWLALALVLAGCGFRGLLAVRCQPSVTVQRCRY
jgi:hypothetical protein